MINKYPKPSGAFLASKTIVNTFPNTTSLLKDRLLKCNAEVKKLNNKYISNCDYLENDYYGSVAACIKIDKNILYYAYVCDCGVIIYDKIGNIKFQTEDDKEKYSDPYIDSIVNEDKTPWNLPEARVLVRSKYRNNTNNIQDSKCVSYGSLTGEETVEPFIKLGTINLEEGDRIIVYSDGLTNYLKENEFINKIINFNKDEFEKYINTSSKNNYQKYGKEKTLILYKI